MSRAIRVAIIGAGPAGLFAAEILSAGGARVDLYDRMAAPARKFLMAGRGGLNLTHSEPLPAFIARYGESAARLASMIEAFPPAALIAWAEGLGQPTFIGSSGRVFPKTMKASPLLRAWLARLKAQGVTLKTRMHWRGWGDDGALLLEHADGARERINADATILALGGASWPRLGADGTWVEHLAAHGVRISPLLPANAGFDVAWSAHFKERFAGQPLKSVAVRFEAEAVRGDMIVTSYGVEGGAIYALSKKLRETIARQGQARVAVDLSPRLTHAAITAKLARAKAGDTLSSALRKTLNLSPLAINLLRETCAGALPTSPSELAALVKAAPLTLDAMQGLARAISTAGGVAWSGVDETLQLRAAPGVYAIGEMLDWEAPTGGYLLQACFATAACASRAILRGAQSERL